GRRRRHTDHRVVRPYRSRRVGAARQPRTRSDGLDRTWPYNLFMRRLTLFLLPLLLTAAPKTVTSIAGTGVEGFSGDGGPATAGQTNNPYGLVIGPDGALYFCEVGNHRIRRLDLKKHTLSTVAGSGTKGYAGDGGPALQASLNEPYEIRFDKSGNMYFAEMQNHVVRRVDRKTKMIS